MHASYSSFFSPGMNTSYGKFWMGELLLREPSPDELLLDELPLDELPLRIQTRSRWLLE